MEIKEIYKLEMKRQIITLLAVLLLTIVIVLAEKSKPQEINYPESYTIQSGETI